MGRSSDIARELQAGLCELYGHLDLDTLPRVALRLAGRLVPSDVAVYNEIDLSRNRVVAAFDPEGDATRILRMAPNWERFIHQHPLVSHFRDRPDDVPRKITDFVPQKAWEELDLFRTFFGPLGLRFQMVTSMPVPSPLIVGISQNRARRDFTERDRRVLDLIRPHLRQAYENAALVTDLRNRARQLEGLMDRIDRGQITIDDGGRVHSASPAAVRFVSEFLPGERLSTTLPPSLRDWALAQVAILRQDRGPTARPGAKMLDGGIGRLAARVIADGQPGRFVVVLSRAARLETAEPLCGMGLTPREAEVLYWCVEGKTRPEIGTLLHISDRTVQKHLEHVYAKLDVPNRVAAVTKALEWLRW
jgi:DNA-binding CsgD family transcriptional regulator